MPKYMYMNPLLPHYSNKSRFRISLVTSNSPMIQEFKGVSPDGVGSGHKPCLVKHFRVLPKGKGHNGQTTKSS